jgi:hypothetical protein
MVPGADCPGFFPLHAGRAESIVAALHPQRKLLLSIPKYMTKVCHSRESGNPVSLEKSRWIPAFAGMTTGCNEF